MTVLSKRNVPANPRMIHSCRLPDSEFLAKRGRRRGFGRDRDMAGQPERDSTAPRTRRRDRGRDGSQLRTLDAHTIACSRHSTPHPADFRSLSILARHGFEQSPPVHVSIRPSRTKNRRATRRHRKPRPAILLQSPAGSTECPRTRLSQRLWRTTRLSRLPVAPDDKIFARSTPQPGSNRPTAEPISIPTATGLRNRRSAIAAASGCIQEPPSEVLKPARYF